MKWKFNWDSILERSFEHLGLALAFALTFFTRVLSISVFVVELLLGGALGLVVGLAIIGAIITPFVYLARIF